MRKLTQQQADTLHLIVRSQRDSDGWSKCSDLVFTQLIRPMPDSLVEVEQAAGKARLTAEARVLMKWP